MNKISRTLFAAALAVTPIALASPAQAEAPVAADASAAPVFTFRHMQSGKCLDGSVSQGVRLHDCNGSKFQQWRIRSDSRAIRQVQGGWCLDGSIGYGVRLNTCNEGPYQRWSW
jgi:Ricin-type beta-trefoil lectin domain